MIQDLEEGVRFFNAKKFFEAHEALEAIWLNAAGEEKIFLHGLIQVAAAFHHFTRGNLAGFRSLLDKGLKKLEKFGDVKDGLNLASLRKQLKPWRDSEAWALTSKIPALRPIPHIEETRRE